MPRWEGNLEQGAFYNGNGAGDYEVIAWNEAGQAGVGFWLRDAERVAGTLFDPPMAPGSPG